jgi:hypothetical protein
MLLVRAVLVVEDLIFKCRSQGTYPESNVPRANITARSLHSAPALEPRIGSQPFSTSDDSESVRGMPETTDETTAAVKIMDFIVTEVMKVQVNG